MKQIYCFFSSFAHRVLTVASARAKLLTAIVLCLFSVGNVWGETATLITSNVTWNENTLSGYPLGDITFKFEGGTTTAQYYNDGLRTYERCKITISHKSSKITNISFTYTINNNGSLSVNTGTWNKDTKEWTGSASEVVFTVGHSSGTKNGQVRITEISITYESAGSLEYNIYSNVTNVTADADNPKTFTGEETDVTLYYTADEGYTLPDEVLVSMGGKPLSAPQEYYWWQGGTEGYVLLYPSSVEYIGLGDITITITAEEIKEPTATILPAEWDFGDVTVGTSVSKTFTLTTANLTDDLSVEMLMGEAGFSVTPSTISSTATSTEITVTYEPTEEKQNVAELLYITGGGLAKEVEVDITAKAVVDPCQGIDLSAPEVTVSDLNPTGFTLSWSEVTGAEKYNVYLYKGTNKQQEVSEEASGMTYTFSNLTPNETYEWEVEVKKGTCYKTTGRQSVTTPKRSYTVTWMLDGAAYTDGNPTTSVQEGDKITALPTAPADTYLGDCANKFMGWSKRDLGAEEGQTAPDDLFTSLTDALAISENTTFYAVFATGGGTTERLYYLSEGQYYIGAFSGRYFEAVSNKETALIFGIEDNKYLYAYVNGEKKYYSHTTTKITDIVEEDVPSKEWAITETETTIQLRSTAQNTRYLGYSTGFRAYSGSHTLIKTSATPINSFASEYTNYVTACVEEECNLTLPLNPLSQDVTSSSAMLTWNAVSGATGYVVTLTTGGVSKEITTTTNSCQLTDLQSFTEYQWTVRATKGKCESASTSSQTFKTLAPCTPLAMPANVKVEWVEGNQYKLSWEAVPNATHYKITGQFNTTIQQCFTMRTLSDLTRGRQYTGTIVATNSGNLAYCDSDPADYSFVYKPYKVTFNAGSGTCPVASLEEATIEELPEAQNNCEGWEFVGWSRTSCAETTTKPTLVTAPYTPTSDHILYAVYAKTEIDEGVGGNTWSLVTDVALLAEGKKVLIVNEEAEKAMGGQNTNNRGAVDVTIENHSISSVASAIALLTLGKAGDNWTFLSEDGFLYAASSSKNYLWSQSSNDANGQWTITIDKNSGDATIIAQGDNKRNRLQYNSSSSLFSCYQDATQSPVQLYMQGGATEVTTYSSKPLCTPCSDAEWYFELGSRVQKIPSAANFTNALISNNTNPITYSSSNPSVATVNPTTGEVDVLALGETTITAKQSRSGDICAVVADYLLVVQEPQVEVVEVTPNSIIIEQNYDDTYVKLQELETSVTGNVAEDIFFSKYFEAASNVKLLAIYNGTGEDMDVSNVRIHILHGKNTQCDCYPENIILLSEHIPESVIHQGQEIVLYSYQKNSKRDETILECIDDAEGFETWIPIPYVYDHYAAAVVFGGQDAVLLERFNAQTSKWEPIDLIGAVVDNTYAQVDLDNCQETPSWGDNKGWNCSAGKDLDGNTFALSTNRCLLIRDKDANVVSGAIAVQQNIGNFNTLCTEWRGRHVDYDGDEQLQDNKNSCLGFSSVAGFDYNNFYERFEDVKEEKYSAKENGDGTVTVTITDLTDRACDYLKIIALNKSNDEVAATLDYKVPIIVQGEKTTTDAIFTSEAEGCATCDVVILKDACLTKAVDGAAGDMPTVRDLEVYAGGKLNLPADRHYQVRSLSFRSKEDMVSSATLEGVLNIATDNTYHDKRIAATRWYWITLPQDCPISNVTFRNGEPAEYGVDWLLKTYDGEQRANTQKGGCWKVFTGSTIKAGVGYILAITPRPGHTYRELRFPMPGYNQTAEHAEKTVPVDDYGAGMDITPNHKGWNLVGNPYVSYYQSDSWDGLTLGKLIENTEHEYELEGNIPYVTIPQNAGNSEYKQVAIGDFELPPFMSYFVQVGGETPQTTDLVVDFVATNRTPKSVAERRVQGQATDKPVWVALELTNAAGEQDKTTLVISDRYTDAYEIGGDLLKWRGDRYTGYTKPVLASAGQDGELAFQALADASALQGVKLHYFAAQQGEYTFSLSRSYDLSAVKEVILSDTEAGTWVDLLQQDYRFRTDRQDNKTRFVLSVRVERAPAVITGVEQLQAGAYALGEDRALRLMNLPADAQVRIYDSLGRLIVSDHTDALQAAYPVSSAGVYNICITVAGERQIIRAIVK